MPQKAAYEFKEGAYSRNAFTNVFSYDDLDMAEEAADSLLKKDHHVSEKEVTDSELDDGCDNNSDAGAPLEPPSPQARPAAPPPQPSAPSVNKPRAHAARSTTDAPSEASGCSSVTLWHHAEPSPDDDSDVAVTPPPPRAKARAREEAARPRSPRPSASAASGDQDNLTELADAADPKGWQKRSKGFAAALRSNKPVLVENTARCMLARAQSELSGTALWQEPLKKRLLDARLELLQKAAHKCSIVCKSDDAEEDEALSALAEEIMADKSRIIALTEFFNCVRNNSLQLLMEGKLKAVTESNFSACDGKLKANVLSVLGTHAVTKLTVTSETELKCLFRFMRASPDGGVLNLVSVGAGSSRTSIQGHILNLLLAKLFKASIAEFIDAWSALTKADLVPPADKHFFIGDAPCPHEWTKQCWVDLSFVSVGCLCVQESKMVGEARISASTATKVREVIENKKCVNIRWRSFAAQKRQDGNHDVPRFLWSMMERIAENGNDVSAVTTHLIGLWENIARDVEYGPDADIIVEVGRWIVTGAHEQVLEVADCIHRLESSAAKDSAPYIFIKKH